MYFAFVVLPRQRQFLNASRVDVHQIEKSIVDDQRFWVLHYVIDNLVK